MKESREIGLGPIKPICQNRLLLSCSCCRRSTSPLPASRAGTARLAYGWRGGRRFTARRIRLSPACWVRRRYPSSVGRGCWQVAQGLAWTRQRGAADRPAQGRGIRICRRGRAGCPVEHRRQGADTISAGLNDPRGLFDTPSRVITMRAGESVDCPRPEGCPSAAEGRTYEKLLLLDCGLCLGCHAAWARTIACRGHRSTSATL